MRHGGAGHGHQSGLDRFDALAARGDDRFDELVVGVLVTAIDQFGEGVLPIGSLVVDAREVEGAERVVRGADEEETGEAARRALQGIAQVRGFERE